MLHLLIKKTIIYEVDDSLFDKKRDSKSEGGRSTLNFARIFIKISTKKKGQELICPFKDCRNYLVSSSMERSVIGVVPFSPFMILYSALNCPLRSKPD